jgi:hypothetical protein
MSSVGLVLAKYICTSWLNYQGSLELIDWLSNIQKETFCSDWEIERASESQHKN